MRDTAATLALSRLRVPHHSSLGLTPPGSPPFAKARLCYHEALAPYAPARPPRVALKTSMESAGRGRNFTRFLIFAAGVAAAGYGQWCWTHERLAQGYVPILLG